MCPLVFISLIVVMLSCLHLYHVIRERRYAQFGGPTPLPLLGSFFEFGNNSVAIKKDMERLAKKFGNTFRIWFGPLRVYIILMEPRDVMVLFSSTKQIHKAADYENFRKWIGDGLLVSIGNKWKSRRRQMNPAYHMSILEKMVPTFNLQGDIFVNKLGKYLNKESFNVYPHASLCSLDIMAAASLGVNMQAQTVERCIFSEAVERGSYIMHLRSYSLWKRNDFLFSLCPEGKELMKCMQIVHGRIDQIIKNRKKELEESIREQKTATENEFGKKHRYALLDLLLRLQLDGQAWSDEDIREEIHTFMFAAQDTVSTCIGFTIYSLATNPDVQEKAFEEIRNVMGDDKSEPATYQQINSLKYLERVIKEALRKYPSIPIMGREIYEDFQINGKIIPAGTSVLAPIFVMQMNPELFPDPQKFDPDRFLTERSGEQVYTYLPFSAGPRNCIGQKFAMLEIKALISNVLRNFEIIPGNDEELVLDVSIVMRPVNGINIKLKNRLY